MCVNLLKKSHKQTSSLLWLPHRSLFFYNNQKVNDMPTKKVKGGYQWGSKGKVYPTKKQADAQGRAAYASGYTGKKK